MDIENLRKKIQGKIYQDEESLREVETDFGRLLRKTPKVLVAPESKEDVQTIITMSAKEGWSVSMRGASHSQSGQSLSRDGILLDLSLLDRIGEMEGESVKVQAGVLWRNLVNFTAAKGLVPPILTNNLDVINENSYQLFIATTTFLAINT